MALAKRGLAENPQDPYFRYAIANAHRLLGHVKEAEALCQALIKDKPDYKPTKQLLLRIRAPKRTAKPRPRPKRKPRPVRVKTRPTPRPTTRKAKPPKGITIKTAPKAQKPAPK